jgi:hypothetical protein
MQKKYQEVPVFPIISFPPDGNRLWYTGPMRRRRLGQRQQTGRLLPQQQLMMLEVLEVLMVLLQHQMVEVLAG